MQSIIQSIYDNKVNEELQINIGKNSVDNWNLLDNLCQDYIWFHVSDYPSSHIILEYNFSNYKKLNKQTLIHCASICKNKSKAKNIKNIEVNYTSINNLYKGEEVGSVYYKDINRVKTITV